MAGTTKTNPLDSFVSETPSTTSVKLPPLPNLAEHVRQHGLMNGLKAHHEEMERWAQNVEQQLNERIQGKPPVSSGNI